MQKKDERDCNSDRSSNSEDKSPGPFDMVAPDVN